MSTCYIRESVIRGHHVFKAHFTPVIRRVLPCANAKCMKEGIYIGRDLRVKVKYFKIPPDILAFTTQNYVQLNLVGYLLMYEIFMDKNFVDA